MKTVNETSLCETVFPCKLFISRPFNGLAVPPDVGKLSSPEKVSLSCKTIPSFFSFRVECVSWFWDGQMRRSLELGGQVPQHHCRKAWKQQEEVTNSTWRQRKSRKTRSMEGLKIGIQRNEIPLISLYLQQKCLFLRLKAKNVWLRHYLLHAFFFDKRQNLGRLDDDDVFVRFMSVRKK